MKKKTFFQTNILWQLFCLMFLAVFVAEVLVGVQLIIGIISNGLGENATEIITSVILLGLFLISMGLTLWQFIVFEHNNIHLTVDKIYMNDDWNNKRNKIQYYTEVYFVDIESVDIFWTKCDSKGKLIKSGLFSALVEKPYLSIKTKNGEVSNFFIMYVSKKDVIRIINEISYRMKRVGNNIDIINIEEAKLKINRKD